MSTCINTDREIWRETPDDYYSLRILVTEIGGIAIDVGGTVYVKTVEEWHGQAKRIQQLEQQIERLSQQSDAIVDELIVDSRDINGC